MSAKSNAFETELLQLLFQNTALAGIGDAAGLQPSAGSGSFYVSLHTASPGETGTQTTWEAFYGSYARVGIVRTGGAWAVASGVATPVTRITFPTCTSGSNTLTHFGVGRDSSGAGMLLWYGALVAPVNVIAGVIPEIPVSGLSVEEL